MGSRASFPLAPAGRFTVALHARAEGAQAIEGVLGALEPLEAEVVEPAVVIALDGIAEGDGIDALLHQIPQGEEIPQGLGHLLPFHQQEFPVDPGVDPGVARGTLALGDLVLVVGKDQVHAAAMDIDALTQELHAHGRAFDVPARSPGAPGGIPGGFAGLEGLPQHEITEGFALVFIGIHGSAHLHALPIQMGQAPILGQARDAEVDAALPGVGQALGLQALNEPNHLGNVFRGPGQEGEAGLRDGHGLQIVEEGLGIATREGLHGLVTGRILGLQGQILLAIADDLVLHIRDVHAVAHLEARGLEGALEQILEQEGPQVADVGEVVDRGPTGVEGDHAGIQRIHGLHPPSEGVEEMDGACHRHASSQSPIALVPKSRAGMCP